eukprot:768740-Hanusia_phi.AAC.5
MIYAWDDRKDFAHCVRNGTPKVYSRFALYLFVAVLSTIMGACIIKYTPGVRGGASSRLAEGLPDVGRPWWMDYSQSGVWNFLFAVWKPCRDLGRARAHEFIAIVMNCAADVSQGCARESAEDQDRLRICVIRESYKILLDV